MEQGLEEEGKCMQSREYKPNQPEMTVSIGGVKINEFSLSVGKKKEICQMKEMELKNKSRL